MAPWWAVTDVLDRPLDEPELPLEGEQWPAAPGAEAPRWPTAHRRRMLTNRERAERIGGQDPSGWVLHRIVKESAHPPIPDAVSAHAA